MPQLSDTPLFTDPFLIHYHKFENVNDTIGSLTLTNNNGVTFPKARWNNGASGGTPNTNKSLTATTPLLTYGQIMGNWSIAGWAILLSLPTGTVRIFQNNAESGGLSNVCLLAISTLGVPGAQFTGGTTLETWGISSPNAMVIGAPIHFTITCTAGAQKFYVNGVSVGTPQTDTYKGAAFSAGNLTGFMVDPGTPVDYAPIVVDDWATFTRVLTPKEIAMLAQSPSGAFLFL